MESQRFLILKNNNLLKNLNINQLSDRQKLGELVAINEGEFVYYENEEAGYVYFIVSGKVKLVAFSDGSEDEVIAENEYFGMSENEDESQHNHSAVALQDTYLLKLTNDEVLFLQGLPKLEDQPENGSEVHDPENASEIEEEPEENLLDNFDVENPEGETEELSFDDSLPYNFDEMKEVPADELSVDPAPVEIEEFNDVTEEEVSFDESASGLPDSYSTPEENFQYSETEAEIVTINDESVEKEDDETLSLDSVFLAKFSKAVNILNSRFLIKDTYDKLLEAACFLTEADNGLIFVAGDKNDFVSVAGDSKSIIKTGMGLSGWAVQKCEPVIVNDVKTSSRFNSEFDEPPEYQTKSMMVLPVKNEKNDVKLVYQLFNNSEGNFTTEHVAVLQYLYNVAEKSLEKAATYESELKIQRVSALKKISGFLDNDIKKPVLVSKRYIEHLRGGYLPDNVDKVLNMMSGNLDSVVELLKTISDYTSGNLKLRLSPLYLNRLLKDYVSNVETSYIDRNIKFRLELDTECKVKLDNSRFSIVLNNVVTNAANAMPDGGELVVSTFVESNFVKIAFRDKGKGIPKEILDYIFEPFISAENANSGLGLFISRVIVEEHRGTIKINSTGEKGTEVIVRMPLDKNF